MNIINPPLLHLPAAPVVADDSGVEEQHGEEGPVQYSTVHYSTLQYSTVQYSTVQYSAAQYLEEVQLSRTVSPSL